VIAIEDTWVSMCSPVSASIPTVALPNDWSTNQDFSAAVVRVPELTDLGDGGHKLIDVLSGLVSDYKVLAPPVEAIIFGSIGVLAHASQIQWNTFNQVLMEMSQKGQLVTRSGDKITKKVIWAKEPYIASLTSTGGAKRLKAFFREEGFGEVSDELCKEIHARKSELFVDYINEHGLTLRPGILSLVQAAKAMKIRLGFCAPTEHNVVHAFLKKLKLEEFFDVLITDLDKPKFENRGKPGPECYCFVVKELLGENAIDANKKLVSGRKVIAFEDTWISMCSSVNASIPTVAMPSEWAINQDFSAAVVCVPELTDLKDSKDAPVAKNMTPDCGNKMIDVLAELVA
jgi:beta-phosphoglucomutase-like phosphatase (HAD superfamily)